MKTVLTDIWADLRDKRLWPIAVLLLIALVAVPVMLSKPAEEPSPAQSSAPKARAASEPGEFKGLASVELDQSDGGAGLTLDAFDPSNPFRPPQNVVDRTKKADEATSGAGPGSATEATGGGGAGTGFETNVGEVNLNVGDGGGGGTTPTDDGSGTTGDDNAKTTQYAYVIDVTFTASGRKRKVTGMEKLDILPSQASPLLIFMGVTENAGNAVFLVDSTLQVAGEGKCKPSRAECGFLYLGAGAEAEFTNAEGDSYTLRIDQIRKVKLGAKGSASKKGKKARAAVGAPPAPRRFSVPILADLISVSTGTDIDSNRDRDDR